MHTRCSLLWLGKQEFSFTCPIKCGVHILRFPMRLCLSKRHLWNDVSFFPSSRSMCGLAAKPSRSDLVYVEHDPLSCSLSIIYFMFVCNLFLLCEASLSQPLPLPHLQLLKQSVHLFRMEQMGILYSDSRFSMMFL